MVALNTMASKIKKKNMNKRVIMKTSNRSASCKACLDSEGEEEEAEVVDAVEVEEAEEVDSAEEVEVVGAKASEAGVVQKVTEEDDQTKVEPEKRTDRVADPDSRTEIPKSKEMRSSSDPRKLAVPFKRTEEIGQR